MRIEAAEKAAADAQREAAILRARVEQNCRAEDTESGIAVESIRYKEGNVGHLQEPK